MKSLPQARQTAYIMTFNTTETFRVLLMNVHEASHGLHIASASRVFFVNLVWQPNVEAQAIKRAHRIGQTRPVYVETLVLRDTLEDQMLQRRKGMTAQEHQKAERSLLDDNTMSTIIQNARFIPLPEGQIHDREEQMAKLEISQQLFARVGNGEGDVDDPDADLIFPEDMPISKRQKTQKRKFGREASPMSASPPPTPIPLGQSNGRFTNLNHHNDVSNVDREDTPATSNVKRKLNDQHAPNLDAQPSSTRGVPPTSLAYQDSVGSASGSTRRVGFASDASDGPASLFGGDSLARPSGRNGKSKSEHESDLDRLPAPTQRPSSDVQDSPNIPTSTASGSLQDTEASEFPIRQSSISANPNVHMRKKRVGFALDTEDI